jgi:hypothetical protein
VVHHIIYAIKFPIGKCGQKKQDYIKYNREEKVQKPSNPIKEKLSIEHEIECPHSYDVMTLHSGFDRLSYLCEECYFTLSLGQ